MTSSGFGQDADKSFPLLFAFSGWLASVSSYCPRRREVEKEVSGNECGHVVGAGLQEPLHSTIAASLTTHTASPAKKSLQKQSLQQERRDDEGESSTTGGEETSEGGCTSSSSEDEGFVIGSGVAPLPAPRQQQVLGCARMRARLSPLLAKVLRHTASSWGIQLGVDGFVPVSDLLKLPPFMELRATLRDVQVAVERCEKKRFAMRSGPNGPEIRANQGHSNDMVDGQALARAIASADLPEMVVHGTYLKNMEQILTQGLKRMGRQHIHLFLEDGGVGRKDAEVLLYIDVAQAALAGIEFLQSENRVILATGGVDFAIPPVCFRKAVRVFDKALLYSSDPSEPIVKIGPAKYVPPHRSGKEEKGKGCAKVPGQPCPEDLTAWLRRRTTERSSTKAPTTSEKVTGGDQIGRRGASKQTASQRRTAFSFGAKFACHDKSAPSVGQSNWKHAAAKSQRNAYAQNCWDVPWSSDY